MLVAMSKGPKSKALMVMALPAIWRAIKAQASPERVSCYFETGNRA
jgi:hypothetical protein